VSAHPDQAGGNLASCTPCHGADYRGTALSRMFATRTLAGQTLTAGTVVGCYTCHDGPNPG
jgi:cytochrome c553